MRLTFKWIIALFSSLIFFGTAQTSFAATNSKYESSSIPTIYLHGFNGGTYSTNDMIKAAKQSGAANKALVVTVKKNGKVDLKGTWSKKIKNPMIQVVFKNNNATPSKQTAWFYSVLQTLKRKYNIQSYNGVGHSLGCNVLVNEAMLHNRDKSIPKLKKLVTIAGPFNGVIGLGDHPDMNRLNRNEAPAIMSASFLAMVRQRESFPHNVKVLNVFGDLKNGTHTDKYVSVASSKSLGYILRGIVKSYQELEITGKQAEHSSLHQNKKVNDKMISFLWGKD